MKIYELPGKPLPFCDANVGVFLKNQKPKTYFNFNFAIRLLNLAVL